MRREHVYFVYMLARKPFGTLYIGVTNDLRKRVEEHRNGAGSKFTAKFKVSMLVWYEVHHDIHAAIQREKSLKRWNRDWKLNLIAHENQHWRDLHPAICGEAE